MESFKEGIQNYSERFDEQVERHPDVILDTVTIVNNCVNDKRQVENIYEGLQLSEGLLDKTLVEYKKITKPDRGDEEEEDEVFIEAGQQVAPVAEFAVGWRLGVSGNWTPLKAEITIKAGTKLMMEIDMQTMVMQKVHGADFPEGEIRFCAVHVPKHEAFFGALICTLPNEIGETRPQTSELLPVDRETLKPLLGAESKDSPDRALWKAQIEPLPKGERLNIFVGARIRSFQNQNGSREGVRKAILKDLDVVKKYGYHLCM